MAGGAWLAKAATLLQDGPHPICERVAETGETRRDGKGMSGISAHLLETRGRLRLGGPDMREFLQGIVSNDVTRVTPDRAIWAAFLTPQGKYLHDFFVAEDAEGALLLDCEAERRADLAKRLKLYKLRSKVELADATEETASVLVWGEGAIAAAGLPAEPGAARPFHGGSLFVDPRRTELGLRALLAAWERARIAAGVPDGSRDMQVDKAILLENGFDELGGVDWKKGCYMGQELTARTKYRGLVKKRLMPVAVSGPLPAPGTPVTKGEREVGELRSGAATDGGGLALALIRLDALADLPPEGLTAGDAKLTPQKPDWASY
jgi:hypothetical protein